MYKVFFTKNVDKAIGKLPRDYQINFAKTVKKLKQDPYALDIKKLSSQYIVTHRLRMGNYRIFLKIKSDKKEVIVYDIRRRTTQTYR